MSIIQEFNLNLIPDAAPVVIHVDQYDHGTGRLVATLYDDETPYAPSGASVYVQGTKPDGKFFVRSTGVSISGNVVTADLAEVMTQVAGRTRMQFVVAEPSGRTGTFVFWLEVQLSALPPDSEMSESDISMVEEAIEQMQELASDAAEAAQESAGFAQNSSDSAEDSEAWAVGTRNGEAVQPGDPTYHNNSKYWAEHGGGQGGGHTIVNDAGQDMPQRGSLQFKGMEVTDDATNDMTVVEGGSGGSTIEVSTSEASLIGEDVTISDGTNTWTKQFDNSGKAIFSGITSTGTLTVSSTDGNETAQYVLTVPYFGNYAVTLAFWSATIEVSTTTSQLNGKTVYAKKNGVVMGSAVFSSGSASITVPEAGSYILEVTLDWKTYQSSAVNVSAETTYSASITGFIAPISLTTPTSEFYGQNIAVTCDGTAVPGIAFDNTGAASFTALQAGTYVFILTYNGEPYTATVVVTSETSYSATIKMFTATINITTTSSDLYGQTITVKKDGVQIGTTQFNGSGQASYTAHDTGSYVFEATYDGYTFSSSAVTVSTETTYSTSITAFTAMLNISTSSSSLYEQTITIKKGTTTVGTATFSAVGTATYNVHETGEYTLICDGHSASVTVSAETTYNVSISAGLNPASWLTAGGLNPASYADFDAVEADEAAVRQLMLVHDAVDYLATASAGDSLMESVIGSDVCAKWINLSDYALDTLYANSDIADEMDTADKYGYGEWIITDSTTTPVTWGAKGNVPIMTANNAPYGTVSNNGSVYASNSAWKAFDGNVSTYFNANSYGGAQPYIKYDFVTPIKPKKCTVKPGITDNANIKSATYTLKGSNDGGTTWSDSFGQVVSEAGKSSVYTISAEADTYYMTLGLFLSAPNWDNTDVIISDIQFYGRELEPLVPTMTANDKPKGEASGSGYYTVYDYYKAFDGNWSDKGWIPLSDSFPQYLQYDFAETVCPKEMKIKDYHNETATLNTQVEVRVSNDNFATYDTIGTHTVANYETIYNVLLSAAAKYKAVRLYLISGAGAQNGNGWKLQFYGMDYSEKEFAAGSTRKTIYDHGVKPNGDTFTKSGTTTTLTEKDYEMVGSFSGSGQAWYIGTANSVSINSDGTYSTLNMKAGRTFVPQYRTIAIFTNIPATSSSWSSYLLGRYDRSVPLDTVYDQLDVSNIQSGYIAFMTTASSGSDSGTSSVCEIWLE